MKKIIIGLVILLLALFFRFNNLNWDANYHLHPDERFLTMVGNAMKLPTAIPQYFDPATSLLNPSNDGYSFFVYGHFPLILTKYLSVNSNLDNYNDFTILGRTLSATFDLLIVILIFKSAFLLEKQLNLSSKIKYWAAFFYAIAVLPIQLSHFFAVDTFLNFFMFGSFYFALRYSMTVGKTPPQRYIIFSALFFGLALSCKITALFILPLNLFFILKTILDKRLFLTKTVFVIFSYFFFAYFTLRFTDPYFFQNSNILDPTINKSFLESISSLRNMTVKDINNWYPPMVQWLSKNTITHSVVNNVIFGLGLINALFVVIGAFSVLIFNLNQLFFKETFYLKKLFSNKSVLIIIFLWMSAFFVYQSLQVTPTLRYFIFLYPFFAIFAGIGINFLLEKIKNKSLFVICYLSFIILLLIWPVMFSSIYFHKNTRVEASEWIYKNLPNNSYILSENWDDSLPMSVVNNYGKQFTGEQLLVFDPDTPAKWQKFNQSLEKADYYILSSNRGWGSIPTVPQKYPLMSKFYNDLLSGKNPNYKKIKEFTSYPSLRYLGIPLTVPDQWSDENFTVYDHPKVMIYEREKNIK